ncbi:MFS transporter [Desulfomarina profundi]|uniref:MFS transporter n=1 Tax=Desulfomarina profundi TaxID=2772557 RepID=A0A8D5JG54_9BACT|nr:MFS transporter [Desulfomarina profundi]BCL59644.1 MFS transporter [Desulfomarina profundi]
MENQIVPGHSNSMRWLILLLIMGGVFLSTMDSGMVNIALPTIMASFSVNLGQTNLVVIIYLLTITATLVFWGTVSDRFGKGRVYLAGLVTFCCGAAGCGFSSSFGFLLFGRFIQALGGAMMMSSGPALIKAVFPAENIGQSLGLIGIATACGLMLGPLVSGLLLVRYSWQSIFFVTVPVAVILYLFGRFFLWKSIHTPRQNTYGDFDWKGSSYWFFLVITLVVTLNALQYFPILAGSGGGLLFVVLSVRFVRVEKNAINPIIPMELIREYSIFVALFTAAASFAALFVVLVLLPYYLKFVLLLKSDKIGIVIMALPATLTVVSPLSGYLYDRIGGRYLTTAGLFLCAVTLFRMAYLSSGTGLVSIAVNLALLGAGQSLFLSPNSASVLSLVSDRFSGIASGILATARNFGMVFGTTLATVLFTFFMNYYGDGTRLEKYSAKNEVDFLLSLKATFLVAAFLVSASAVLSFSRRN